MRLYLSSLIFLISDINKEISFAVYLNSFLLSLDNVDIPISLEFKAPKPFARYMFLGSLALNVDITSYRPTFFPFIK